jgi:hypothetical protein
MLISFGGREWAEGAAQRACIHQTNTGFPLLLPQILVMSRGVGDLLWGHLFVKDRINGPPVASLQSLGHATLPLHPLEDILSESLFDTCTLGVSGQILVSSPPSTSKFPATGANPRPPLELPRNAKRGIAKETATSKDLPCFLQAVLLHNTVAPNRIRSRTGGAGEGVYLACG